MTSVRVEEREIELEWIVLAKVWRESAVFKTVVEDPEAATYHEFGRGLIREPKARSDIALLPHTQALAILADGQSNAIMGKQASQEIRVSRIGAIHRSEIGEIGFPVRNQVGRSISGWAAWNEVGLEAAVLIDRLEVIPA